MPELNGSISIVTGDYMEIRRSVSGVPAGETLAKAYFTAKNALSDVDASAIFQKSITPTPNSVQGVIEDTGASGTAVIRFYLQSADTEKLGNPLRGISDVPYDIEVITNTGKVFTPEIGKISPISQVTLANT